MRILLLCTDAYGGHGGIALFNRELCASLSSFPGVEEIVVVPRVIVHEPEPLPPRVTLVPQSARGAISYIRTARRIARAGHFELVICGHINLLPVARLAVRDPLLITHGIDAWKPLRIPLRNRLVHSARGVVAVSQLTRDRLVGWSGYGGPTYVLPNAIHREQYGLRPRNEALAARYGLEPHHRVILTLGRVHAAERYKGFDEVMEVVPRLAIPDLRYVIAGTGNDIPRLRKKAGTLGIERQVIFTGFVAEEEKADLYNLADVYVMPSRGEGFGFVFLEALASGVPVIGSRHDGGREALLGGTLGQLVDPANPADLRDAIEEALARRERRVPEGLEYFSFENFEARVHEIVRIALGFEVRRGEKGSTLHPPSVPSPRKRGEGS